MIKLEDIIVWRANNGVVTITSCLESKKIATIVNHKIEWFFKDECSSEVIAWIEENA